jgi:ApaG protein
MEATPKGYLVQVLIEAGSPEEALEEAKNTIEREDRPIVSIDEEEPSFPTIGGVDIDIETFPLREYSQASEYAFGYKVSINNHSNFSILLEKRNWNIYDSNGRLYRVTAPTVGGLWPVIESGTTYSYTTALSLPTASGTIDGYYSATNINTKRNVIVPVKKHSFKTRKLKDLSVNTNYQPNWSVNDAIAIRDNLIRYNVLVSEGKDAYLDTKSLGLSAEGKVALEQEVFTDYLQIYQSGIIRFSKINRIWPDIQVDDVFMLCDDADVFSLRAMKFSSMKFIYTEDQLSAVGQLPELSARSGARASSRKKEPRTKDTKSEGAEVIYFPSYLRARAYKRKPKNAGRDGGVPNKNNKNVETLKSDIARLIDGQKELEHRERLLALVMQAFAKFEASLRSSTWSSMAMELSGQSDSVPVGLSEEELRASLRLYERVKKRAYRARKVGHTASVKKLTQG